MIFANRLYILVHLHQAGIGSPDFLASKIPWFLLSSNPNMAWQLFDEFIDKPWNFESMLTFLPLSYERLVMFTPNKLFIKAVSQNPTLTLDIIDKIDGPWNWVDLSMRMPLNIILENPIRPWIWRHVLFRADVLQKINDGVNLADMHPRLAQLERFYHNRVLASAFHQPNARISSMKTYRGRIPWHAFATNSNMPMTRLIEGFGSVWPLQFSHNPGLTIDILRQHIGEDWNWQIISAGHLGTIENVRNNPDFPWSWFMLSANPRITYADIAAYPGNWYPHQFLENASFSIRELLANKVQDWDKLVCNKFTCHPVIRSAAIKRHLMQKYGRRWLTRTYRLAHSLLYRHVMHHLHMWARDSITGNLKFKVRTNGSP